MLSVTAGFDHFDSLPTFLLVDDADRPALVNVGEDRRGLSLIRLNPNSGVDTSFGPDGLQTISLGTGSQVVGLRSLLRQPDGHWIAVMSSSVNGYPIVALARLDTDPPAATVTPVPPTAASTPTTTPTSPPPTATHTASASPTIHPTVTAQPTTPPPPTVTRTRTATRTPTTTRTATRTPNQTRTPSASPTAALTPTPTATPGGGIGVDPGYGSGGRLNLGGILVDARPIRLRTATGGRLMVLAYGRDPHGAYRYGLARFTMFGQLDTSYGQGGVVLIDEPALPELTLEDFAVAPDATITLVGTTWLLNESGDSTVAMIVALQRLASGARSADFGDGGAKAIALDTVSVWGQRIIHTPQGWLIGGQTDGPAGLLARLDESGQLDDAFGSDGIVIHEPYGSSSVQFDRLWLTIDQRIMVDGTQNDDGTLWRFHTQGALDTGFALSGEFPYRSADENALVAFGRDGQFFRVREDHDGDDHVFVAVEAYDMDGQPRTSWGQAGHLEFSIGDGNTLLGALVLRNGALLVLIGPRPTEVSALEAPQSEASALLLRIDEGGERDLSFGEGGVVTLPVSGAEELISQDDDSVLIVAGDEVLRLAALPALHRITLPQLQRP